MEYTVVTGYKNLISTPKDVLKPVSAEQQTEI